MEEWKVIPGYENYAISKNGEVKSIRFNRILKSSNSDSGYLYINLVSNKINKTHSVHKLVIENFGNPKPDANFVIDHKDGNKNNNKIENLQWVSIKENTERGYNNYDQKTKIIELHKAGLTPKQIKEQVTMGLPAIYQLIHKFKANQYQV